MKKLIFIRHSKAEDPTFDISDFERSLTTKGKYTANAMALRLKEKEKSIGTIISSPAFRAVETALIFSGIYRKPSNAIILDDNIYYNFTFKTLLEILSKVKEDEDTVTLFGHNPSFTELAFRLSAGECDSLPKCGIVAIEFNVNLWTEITKNTGNVVYKLKP
jgi:phosphohistidine phosphatase